MLLQHPLRERLRTELNAAIAPARATASVVLIPKREIEAWLLYDGAAIATAFRQNEHPRLPGNPESLLDPKKYLRDLIWRKYGKDYLNTVHNARIARHIRVSYLRGSRSLAPHFGFIKTVRSMLN